VEHCLRFESGGGLRNVEIQKSEVLWLISQWIKLCDCLTASCTFWLVHIGHKLLARDSRQSAPEEGDSSV
jgi:hypothetical protein